MKSLILFLLLSYTAAADIYPKPANKAHWAPPDAKMLTEMKPFVDRLNETTPPKYGLAVLPLFARGEFAAANARLLKTDTSRYDSDLWNGMEMMSIWMMYHDKLTPEAKSFIVKTMTAAIDGRGSIRTKGKSGMGANKELSACVIRMLAGEQFDRRELAEKAQTIVDRMAADWSTRGSYREYNSPTYQAVYMIGLSMIWMYTSDAVVARKAKILQERAWMEMAMRLHTPSWSQVGPFERAYGWDLVGWGTDTQYLYRHAVGSVFPLAECLAFKSSFAVDHYPMDYRLSWAGKTATQTHNCPAYLSAFMRRVQEDFSFSSTVAEDEHEALVTYLDRNISLGSATRNVTGNGQACHVAGYWSRGGIAKTKEDRRSFAMPDSYHVQVFQKKNRMLTITNPYFGNTWKQQIAYRLCNYRDVDEIRVGGQTIALNKGFSVTDDLPVTIRDGDVYIGFKPLQRSSKRSRDAVRIYSSNTRGFDPELKIQFSSVHSGSAKTPQRFDEHPAFHVVAVEVANAADYASFDDFSRQVQNWDLRGEYADSTIKTRCWKGTEAMEAHLGSYTRPNGKQGFKLVKRLCNGQSPRPGLMMSSVLFADSSGRQTINDATLETKEGVPGILWSDPVAKAYVGMNPSNTNSPLKLTTPAGILSAMEFGFGRVQIIEGSPTVCNIEAVTVKGPVLWADRPRGGRVIVNGKDMTADGKVDGGSWSLTLY